MNELRNSALDGNVIVTTAPNWFKDRLWLWLVLCLFFLLICFVNPIREVTTSDDFAYARTLRHLLETGQYQLDDWCSANMPVQAYWGLCFVKIFGYSFSVLTLSTLVLLALGLLAFYALLREQRLNDAEASLLTLALLSSPRVLFLSFTFMTDVQFLAWLLIALWLYVRGLNRSSLVTVLLASVAAAGAIGTRQFGMALVAGLLAAWALDKRRWRKLTFYATGLALPILFTAWQLWFTSAGPTFFMTINLNLQSEYLHDLPKLVLASLWRVTVILQIVGFFLMPLMLSLVWTVIKLNVFPSQTNPCEVRVVKLCGFSPGLFLSLIGWTVFISLGVFYGCMTQSDVMLNWLRHFAYFYRHGYVVIVPWTLVTAGCAIFLGWFYSSAFQRGYWTPVTPTRTFLTSTALTLLALTLICAGFWDRYVIPFLPFAILALAPLVRAWRPWCRLLALVSTLLMLMASALFSRGVLEEHEASWKAAEAVRSAGVPSEQIHATWAWNGYHGSFQDWIMDVRGQDVKDVSSFFYGEWHIQRKNRASYWIVQSTNPPAGESWQVLDRIPRRGYFLGRQYTYVVKRVQLP